MLLLLLLRSDARAATCCWKGKCAANEEGTAGGTGFATPTTAASATTFEEGGGNRTTVEDEGAEEGALLAAVVAAKGCEGGTSRIDFSFSVTSCCCCCCWNGDEVDPTRPGSSSPQPKSGSSSPSGSTRGGEGGGGGGGGGGRLDVATPCSSRWRGGLCFAAGDAGRGCTRGSCIFSVLALLPPLAAGASTSTNLTRAPHNALEEGGDPSSGGWGWGEGFTGARRLLRGNTTSTTDDASCIVPSRRKQREMT